MARPRITKPTRQRPRPPRPPVKPVVTRAKGGLKRFVGPERPIRFTKPEEALLEFYAQMRRMGQDPKTWRVGGELVLPKLKRHVAARKIRRMR